MFFQGNEKYNCATYLRLSRSDGDQQESNSIKNQRALLNDYMGKHPELHKFDEYVDDGYSGTNFERPDFKRMIENQRMLLHDYIGKQEDLFGEIVEYVDDGYTGTNFNRPAFQKMIVDLKQGDIKVIMVKDLSRLGRDYIGVGDYIEQIFPLMGVRFIAVNNSFDSMKLNNGTPGIEVAVSNLVNNMYSRDIAKKIRAALETNWKNGKATCTNVPFGYVWNKKGGQRWEIDPEAAPCVKKVFELALSGRNTTQIAYGMNELNLPTPGLYAAALHRGSSAQVFHWSYPCRCRQMWQRG